MRLDPRTKLLLLACTSLAAFAHAQLSLEGLLFLPPLFLLLQSGRLFSALKYGAAFIGLLALQLLLVPRLPLAAGGVLFIFALYIRRLLPCFMLAAYLMRTTKVSQFLAAVRRLRLPKGLTVALAIALRYFPTMREEWQAIREAMALRGISLAPCAVLRHPLRTMEYVYVPMLVSAAKISDEMTQAALTRGIERAEERSCLERVGFSGWDGLLLATYAALLGFVIFNLLKGGA